MLAVPFDGSKEGPVIAKPEVLFKDEYDFCQGLTTATIAASPGRPRWFACALRRMRTG